MSTRRRLLTASSRARSSSAAASRTALPARPELGAHPAEQLGDTERLSDAIVGAPGHSIVAAGGGRPGCGHDHPDVMPSFVASELGENGAVALQHVVEQD